MSFVSRFRNSIVILSDTVHMSCFLGMKFIHHMYHAILIGPLLAFPIQNICVAVTSLTLGSVTSLPVLSSCISECVSKALREAEVQLLEPCTNMAIVVPEEHLGAVLSDLTSQRRGQVKEVGSIQDSREITAITPLACLMVRKNSTIAVYMYIVCIMREFHTESPL